MSLAIHWAFGTAERERERENERATERESGGNVEQAVGPILSEEQRRDGRTFGRWGHVPPSLPPSAILPGGRAGGAARRHAQWSRTSVKDGQMEKKERARERERDGGQSD